MFVSFVFFHRKISKWNWIHCIEFENWIRIECRKYSLFSLQIIIIEFIFINQIICSRQFFLQIKYFYNYRITIFSEACDSEQHLFKFSYFDNLLWYYFFFSILSNTFLQNSKFSSSNLIPNYLNLNLSLKSFLWKAPRNHRPYLSLLNVSLLFNN